MRALRELLSEQREDKIEETGTETTGEDGEGHLKVKGSDGEVINTITFFEKEVQDKKYALEEHML